MRGSAGYGRSCDSSLVPQASSPLAGNELAVTHRYDSDFVRSERPACVVQSGRITLLFYVLLVAGA
jgi:hypothetical protein